MRRPQDRFTRELDLMFPHRHSPLPDLSDSRTLRDVDIEIMMQDLQDHLADFFDDAYNQCSGPEDEY